jgi:hypothetical protein
MRIVVCADDGDEITVNVDELGAEQRVIRLELHNFMFGDIGDYEAITLTIERARELASAILTIADAFGDCEMNSLLPLEPRQSGYPRAV